ncbi:MAG: lysylphosphatidylglycerol synthase transmembrane domain-containing protein [Acidobacteriota bacterium]
MTQTRPPDAGPQRPASAGRKRLIFALRLALTAALLALLARWIDPRAAREALASGDPRFLLALVLVRPFLILVRGLRIWHLVRVTSERPLPLASAVGWHFVSVHLGVFTPAGLGELSMAYFLRRRHRVSEEHTVAAMMLDKLITLGVLSILGLVGAILYLGIDARAWLAGAALAGLAALWALSRGLTDRDGVEDPGQDAGSPSKRSVGRRIILTLRSAGEVLARRPGAILANVAAAVLQSLLFTAQIWLCFRMFGAGVSFFGIFWISGLGRLVNLLPITLGGLGVYEGSMVLLLEQLGTTRELALAAVLIPRTLTWLIAGAVAGAALWSGSASLLSRRPSGGSEDRPAAPDR